MALTAAAAGGGAIRLSAGLGEARAAREAAAQARRAVAALGPAVERLSVRLDEVAVGLAAQDDSLPAVVGETRALTRRLREEAQKQTEALASLVLYDGSARSHLRRRPLPLVMIGQAPRSGGSARPTSPAAGPFWSEPTSPDGP